MSEAIFNRMSEDIKKMNDLMASIYNQTLKEWEDRPRGKVYPQEWCDDPILSEKESPSNA